MQTLPLTPSRRTSLAFALLASLSLSLTGCKKKDKETVDPDEAASDTGAAEGEGEGEGEGEEGEPEVTYPEQGEDPPELAQARELFMIGKYTESADLVAPLVDSLLDDSQIRARGIAAAIQGMALAQDIAENGHLPAELALEQAARLADPVLTQYAKSSIAVYHLGVQEYAKAEAELLEVVETASENQEFTQLLRAEAVLGQAFEEDKLKYPEKLEEAAKLYEAIWTSTSSEVMKGRAADGLTAVGYYKKDKDFTCKWAGEASTIYEAVGASDYMKEGPKGPADAFRCAP